MQEIIQKITTTYTSLKISVNFVGLHCMSSTISHKHRDVIADAQKCEEMPECLTLYQKICLKQNESQGDTNAGGHFFLKLRVSRQTLREKTTSKF